MHKRNGLSFSRAFRRSPLYHRCINVPNNVHIGAYCSHGTKCYLTKPPHNQDFSQWIPSPSARRSFPQSLLPCPHPRPLLSLRRHMVRLGRRPSSSAPGSPSAPTSARRRVFSPLRHLRPLLRPCPLQHLRPLLRPCLLQRLRPLLRPRPLLSLRRPMRQRRMGGAPKYCPRDLNLLKNNRGNSISPSVERPPKYIFNSHVHLVCPDI
jgi:hypothetical protein